MLNPDNYQKFLRSVEERIDSADIEMKRKAESALKAAADNYRKLVSERMAIELGMVDEAEATGDWAAAQHHRVLAQVYKSMLDSGLAV